MRSDGTHEGFKLGEVGFLKNGQGRPVAEHWAGGTSSASIPGLAEPQRSQRCPGKEHTGAQAGTLRVCTSLDLSRSPAVIFVLLFGAAPAPSLTQPIWCSQSKLGQGCKEPVVSRPCFHTYSDRACAASRTSRSHLFGALFEIIFFVRLK